MGLPFLLRMDIMIGLAVHGGGAVGRIAYLRQIIELFGMSESL